MAAVPSIGRAAEVEPQPAGAGATQDLYERYAGQIYGYCVNRLGSRDEAEDATQSTFLNAHRALQRGVTPEAELAWLFKIAHNVCLTRRRSSRRRNRVETPSDLGAVQDVLPAPSRESSDELIRLTDALEHMPDNQRRAILLREWQGLSYHEIAEDLEVTQSAVETLIFRARRALATNLEHDPNRPRLLSRVRKAFDIGTLLAGLKTLFATSAAVKATAAAVAVSGAAVVATNVPEPASKPASAAEPAAVAAQASVSSPLVASVDPRRGSPAHVRRGPAAGQERRSAVAASAKARAAKPLSPGQARKATVVKKEKSAKPVRVRPAAASKAKPAPVEKAVRTNPTLARAKTVKPQRRPAATAKRGGNDKGQAKQDR
jgi:RNA polymerase sigma-70 factor (ECF subfamily)